MTNKTEVTQREVVVIRADLKAKKQELDLWYSKTVGLKAAMIMHVPLICEGDRLASKEALETLAHGNDFFKEFKDGKFILKTDDMVSHGSSQTKELFVTSCMEKYITAGELEEQHTRVIREYKACAKQVRALTKELDLAEYKKMYDLADVLERVHNEDKGIVGKEGGKDKIDHNAMHNMGSVQGYRDVVEHIRTGVEPCKW